VKIADKTLPMIAETATVKKSLALSTKSLIENEQIEEERGKTRDGYE